MAGILTDLKDEMGVSIAMQITGSFNSLGFFSPPVKFLVGCMNIASS